MSNDDKTIVKLALRSAALLTVGYLIYALLIAKAEPKRIIADIILVSAFCWLPLILVILGNWLWEWLRNRKKDA